MVTGYPPMRLVARNCHAPSSVKNWVGLLGSRTVSGRQSVGQLAEKAEVRVRRDWHRPARSCLTSLDISGHGTREPHMTMGIN